MSVCVLRIYFSSLQPIHGAEVTATKGPCRRAQVQRVAGVKRLAEYDNWLTDAESHLPRTQVMRLGLLVALPPLQVLDLLELEIRRLGLKQEDKNILAIATISRRPEFGYRYGSASSG